ncbi:MAG: glutathione S-transferase [Bordetella sp. SCN 68-11]|nr:MAG: glutathione S-transferase [Bordetella sp. SCN 68-11]
MSTKHPARAAPIRLYSMTYSGHGHRVQLLLSLLGLPYEKIDVDPHDGVLKTPGFLAMNPFGQVPVIVDGDTTLHDSNAILVYLARKYGGPSWLPEDPEGSALVQQWFSLAAGPIAFGPCAARRLQVYGEELVPMASAVTIGVKLFPVLESMLSVADVAAYTYIAHAPEGGLSLEPYPAIRAWLARIEGLPGFIPMPGAPARAPDHPL